MLPDLKYDLRRLRRSPRRSQTGAITYRKPFALGSDHQPVVEGGLDDVEGFPSDAKMAAASWRASAARRG